ncbi:MAG: NusA antitermination factor [Parcubacteria group bacterium GW2011_GWC1_43_11]|nr:MAG: NusA antitermination factor [Parcubacteria group bacterium GW2011_GWC1_43_11]
MGPPERGPLCKNMDLKQLASALGQISEEKGISQEKIIETIEMALAAAYKKEYGEKGQIIRAKFNPKTGDIKFFQIKIVVDESMLKPEEEENDETEPSFAEAMGGKEGEKKIRFNEERHIMIDEAKKISAKGGKDAASGDELEFILETREDFGRIAAQTAKQVIIQRIREAEREAVWNEYKDKEGELVSGIIQRVETHNTFIDLGKTIAIFPKEEQVFSEKYYIGTRMKFYILSVNSDPKGPGIVLSRSHPKMISRLFELEVPEIGAGTVEIKSIAREAGNRTKIAVASNEEGVDPVGSCVGQKGTRVAAVISELSGEKIDIIEWSEDPEIFVANAMSPAKVTKIEMMPRRHTAKVYVPENQLSLAIGKAGQNVRLAAKLTGWKIDVAGATLTSEGLKEGALLEDLAGVGEKTAQLLHDAGFNTPEDILNSSVDKLTEVEGIGEKTAEKIFKSAQELLKPKIIAEAKPESKEEVVEEKIEEKGIIEEAARVAEKELAEEAREEGIKEGIEESPMEQSGIETEPSAEKEIEEELKPKDFE